MAAFRTTNPALIALYCEVKKLNLKPINRLQFQFDPFHQEVHSIRNFLFHISSKKVRKTSDRCILKTDIVNDRSEPTLSVSLDDGFEVIFKTSNLTTLELAQEFNNIISKFQKLEEANPVTLKGAVKKSTFRKKSR